MSIEGSVLGIDVGWSQKKKSSAVCRLSWSDREVEWHIRRFRSIEPDRKDTIKCVVDDHDLLAVAIDGTLRPSLDEIGHYRSAEYILTQKDIREQIGKPGQSSSPNGKKLNEQANKSAMVVKNFCHVSRANHQVRIDERAIVEAFPTTFLGVMVDRPKVLQHPKQKSDRYFVHLANHQRLDGFLESLLSDRKWTQTRKLSEITNHDDRAAFVCALTALSVAAGEFTAVGDEDDGWIILPPKRMFADWAWKAICGAAVRNCNEKGKLLTFVENQECSTEFC